MLPERRVDPALVDTAATVATGSSRHVTSRLVLSCLVLSCLVLSCLVSAMSSSHRRGANQHLPAQGPPNST
jgi:hypothetical protein